MLVCCDTETHRFRRGYMTPRMVCMSLSVPQRDQIEFAKVMGTIEKKVGEGHIIYKELPIHAGQTHCAWLLDRVAAKAAWAHLTADPSVHWLFHSAGYDVRVMIQEVPSSTKDVVKAYEDRRIWDTVPREKIMANSVNQLTARPDPFTGKLGKRGLFTMAMLVMRYFDVDVTGEKLDPEAWRTRYAELDGKPLKKWPARAVDYALLDAVWPIYIADAQESYHPYDVGGENTRCPLWPEDRSPPTDGHAMGLTRFTAEVHQARCMVAFEAAAAWGFRSNPQRVAETVSEWRRLADEGAQIGIEHGFVITKKDGTTQKKLVPLRKRVAAAYGDVPISLELGLDKALYDEEGWESCPIPKDQRKTDNKTWKMWRKRRVKKLVKRLKLPDIYSDVGSVRYASEVLERSGDPVLEAYAESTSYATYLTKYASMLQEAAHVPLTYSIDTMKATMRTSKRNPPYDQPPRKGGFREAHQPRAGWVYVMADYDQAELRAMAQIHRWWGLGDGFLQQFVEGIDPHIVVAVELLNAEHKPAPEGAVWTYELFCRAYHEREFGKEWRDLTFDYRQLAKVANFGFRGGLGPATFVTYARGRGVLGLTVERATRVRDIWRQTCPEDTAYLREIGDWLKAGPEPEDEDEARKITVALPFTGLVRGGVTYTSGANGNFQHLIAATLAWTGFELWKEQMTDYGTGLYGTRTVLPLHDEIIIEAREEVAHEAAVRLEEVMQAGMRFHLPDVPPAAEATVTRVWSKEAKRLVDPDTGRLIPWEPTKE